MRWLLFVSVSVCLPLTGCGTFLAGAQVGVDAGRVEQRAAPAVSIEAYAGASPEPGWGVGPTLRLAVEPQAIVVTTGVTGFHWYEVSPRTGWLTRLSAGYGLRDSSIRSRGYPAAHVSLEGQVTRHPRGWDYGFSVGPSVTLTTATLDTPVHAWVGVRAGWVFGGTRDGGYRFPGR